MTKQHSKKQVIQFASGFDLADPADAAVSALYQEWSDQAEEHYRIPSGYQGLINYLQERAAGDGCKVLLNKVATRITWEQNNVSVTTIDGEKYQANKLLVKYPLVSYKENINESMLTFKPEIEEHKKAAQNIGIGQVIKNLLFKIRTAILAA